MPNPSQPSATPSTAPIRAPRRAAWTRAWPTLGAVLGLLLASALAGPLTGCAGPAPADSGTSTGADAAVDTNAGPDDATLDGDPGGPQGIDAIAADTGEGDTTPAPDTPGPQLPTTTITSVSPAEGPTGGLTEVEIAGTLLGDVATVYFGESPAIETFVLDDWTVRAVAPPRPAGWVDITVRSFDADGEAVDVTLPLAYRYVAKMAVTAVEPQQGDVAGGTLVTVHGEGFDADTTFIFGERVAIKPLVLDEHTATMHTPPGVVGRVDVVAASPGGSATFADGYEYRQQPRIDGATPAVVGLLGGVTRVRGVGLVGAGGVVSLVAGASATLLSVQGSAPDGSWIDVVLPARNEGGTFGLRYSRPGATVTREDAVTYATFVDMASGKPVTNGIAAVSPGSLAANVEGEVELHLVGPIAAWPGAEVKVWVGGSTALASSSVTVLDHDVAAWVGPQPGATVRVRVPALAKPWTPIAQGVLVRVGSQEAFLPGGLERTAAEARIVDVLPKRLKPAGGSGIVIGVEPDLATLGPVIGVRVGALFASNVTTGGASATAPLTVHAIAPAGSPGPADVTVVFAKGEATLPSAVLFAGEPGIVAVLPASGARAGGTLVRVLGDGLDELDRIFFGDIESPKAQAVHPGLALVRTPRGEVGTVAVEGWFAGLGGSKVVASLQDAYTYFDPQAGNAGTWGGPIDGALNVTALRSNDDKGPIEGALVVVEQPGKPMRTALTDDRGQATVSELDLHGPLMVSVGRSGYSAASLVAVDSQHITVRLRKNATPPPDNGAGSGEEPDEPVPYPDGAIEGVALNAEKYAALPLGSCVDTPVTGGNCASCTSDLDCPGALTCETLADPLAGFGQGPTPLPDAATATLPRLCAAPCGGDGDPACPGGFQCRATGWQQGVARMRCLPTIGTPQVRCRTSTPGLFGGNPDPGPAANAAPDGTFRIEARLGEVAVACTAGYVAKGSDTFVPLAMGLARHVWVTTGETTKAIKVVIDTPMTRTIDLELSHLPMGSDTVGMERFATAVLDLGPEGYLPMADVSTRLVTDRLRLERQPSALKGGNVDIAWTFYAGISQVGGGSPLAIAIAERLKPTDAEHLAVWLDAADKPEALDAFAPRVRAVASDGSQTLAVGDHGYIGLWGGTALTQQSSPTSRDLGAIWLDPFGSGVGYAGGARATLLRRDPLTGWQAAVAPMPVAIELEASGTDTIVGLAGSSETDLWLLDGANRIWHRGVAGWSLNAAPLPAPAKPGNTWPPKPVTPVLRALTRLGDGALVVCGDNASAAIAMPVPASSVGGEPPLLTWMPVGTGHFGALHAAWGVSAADYWLAGDAGGLYHVVGGKAYPVATGTHEPLFAVGGFDGGVVAAGGGATWVRIGLDGKTSMEVAAGAAMDIRALTAVPGGVLGLGVPALRVGPFVELPYITTPTWGSKLGSSVQWQTAPGVTPTLNMLRIATPDYTTRWEIFLRGDTQQVDLPDFLALAGFSPIPPGQLRLRLWRIYAPGLTIDQFQSKQLSVWQWVSYAYTLQATSLPVTLGPLPSAIDPPKLPPPP